MRQTMAHDSPEQTASQPAANRAPFLNGPVAGRLARAGVFLALYLGLTWIGSRHAAAATGSPPWDLAGGLGLGLLLLAGPRWFPLVLFADIAGSALFGSFMQRPVSAGAAALISTFAYAQAARQLGRRGGGGLPERERELLWLVIIGVGAGLARALCDMLETGAWGQLESQETAYRLMEGWTGAFLGAVIIAPTVVLLAGRRWPGRWGPGLEATAAALLLVGLLSLILPPATADPFRFFYLLFLPLIWIAVRFGLQGVVLANLLVQAALIGFFLTHPDQADDAFNYQFRLLALALSSLFLGVAVSERRDVEGSLRQRQAELARVSRLSLAGEMAAALAHELNQPLLATVAFARSAQRFLKGPAADTGAAQAAIDDAVAQAERAGAIIRALRRFIGKAETDRRAQDFATLAQNAVDLTQAERGRAGVRLDLAIDRPLAPVVVDGVQVEQVLVNLIQNAVNALDGAPGPRTVLMGAWRGDDDMLEVEVRDNGPGMPSEMAAQMFEPFSGGGPRSGLGLGLVIARGLVEAHGGRLWLARNEPGGCAFRFTLPMLAVRTR